MIKILNILLMLFLMSGTGEVKYKILSLSTETIKIGSEVKRKGDTFFSNEKIHWVSDTQTMRVVDVETERSFVISSKAEEFLTRHTKSTYNGVVNSLITHLKQRVSDERNGGYHYLCYSQEDGSLVKVRIEKDMFLDEYPRNLQLFYFNSERQEARLQTDDLRGLVDELIITDHMVKRQMSGLDYFKGEQGEMTDDYMLLMNTYIDEKYTGVLLTYEDIKMLITLKY